MNTNTQTMREQRIAKSDADAMVEAREVAQNIADRFAAMKRREGSIESSAVIVESDHLAEDGYPHCEYCQDARFIVQEYTRLGRVVDTKTVDCPRCNVAAKKRLLAIQKYSSMSDKARAQDFASYELMWMPTGIEARQNLLAACKTFADTPKGFLVIYGSYGCGKSHLCAAIYNTITARGKMAIFISMLDLIRSLKALFNKRNEEAEGETYDQRLNVYQTVETLILDDIGAGRMTEFDDSLLTEIVDYRYRNRMATVFVSNKNMTSRSDFDARVVERWSEHGFSTVVEVVAPSYRTGDI